MASYIRQRAPGWFNPVAILLLAWSLMGCYACYMQLRLGPEAWGDPAHLEYDRALYAALPFWYNYVYVVAVGSGLLGAVALLARKAVARALFAISLAAVVIQFGYALLATDLVAHKGAAMTVPFPLFVIAAAAFALWFAMHARRRGWIS